VERVAVAPGTRKARSMRRALGPQLGSVLVLAFPRRGQNRVNFSRDFPDQ
jgi:hypothetical protein